MPAHESRRLPAIASRPCISTLPLRPALLWSVLFATSACVSSPAARISGSLHTSGMPGVVARAQDFIGREQLMGTGERSMYDALLQVRADLFRPRSATGGAPEDALPAVYVNGFYQGSLDVLRGLTTDVVRDIQLVRSIDTSMRFGRAHPAGALMIRLQLR